MKTNKRKREDNLKGVSLIVLVITIIIIMILSTTVILTIASNNPIEEANKARYEMDVDSMQALFTNTVAKVMVKNRSNVKITSGVINSVSSDAKETIGEVIYTISDSILLENMTGTIVFDKGENTDTVFYTGKKLPVYSAGNTKWYVDSEGTISLEIAGVKYGDGRTLNEELSEAKGVNVPILPSGATAIKWNASYDEVLTTEDDIEWFEYVEQTSSTTNGGTSHWANCKMEDGSYFVWIPRYAYKIDSTNQTIDVKFTKYESGKDVAYDGSNLDGYTVHPVFTNNVAAGGWDRELTGIWVAKYEACEPNSNGQTGDMAVSSSISGKKLPIFKPNRRTYVSVTPGQAYQLSKEYNLALNSHMMKNSEWGAVAYLAHSQYGRNGTKITINNSWGIISGNAANSSTDTGTVNTVRNAYNTAAGTLASTTGNIYGIYDMNGGSWEIVASYISNGHENLINNAAQMINDGKPGVSNKYKTVYSYNSTSDTFEDNYNLAENKSRKGEAIWETSTAGINYASWYGVFSYFLKDNEPIAKRGGCLVNHNSTNIFAFASFNGVADTYHAFRVVLVN